MAYNGFSGLSRPMRANERRVADTATAPARPRLSVAAPISGEQPSATPLGKALAQIKTALDKFEDDVAPILNGEQAGTVAPEGRSQMVNDAAAPALNAIDEAEAQAADLASAADDAYKNARAGLSRRPNTALDAMLHQQWWSCTVRELDATSTEKLVGVVQRLIAGAEPDELAWAATELPSYLRFRDVDPGDWLDAALHQVHPGLRQAAERSKLAHQAADILASNARTARKALASTASGSYKRPRLVNPSPKYDPDAQAELVGPQRGPTTRDGYRP
jgi:hypothetical protein